MKLLLYHFGVRNCLQHCTWLVNRNSEDNCIDEYPKFMSKTVKILTSGELYTMQFVYRSTFQMLTGPYTVHHEPKYWHLYRTSITMCYKKKLEIIIHRTTILPAVSCGCETRYHRLSNGYNWRYMRTKSPEEDLRT